MAAGGLGYVEEGWVVGFGPLFDLLGLVLVKPEFWSLGDSTGVSQKVADGYVVTRGLE